MTTVEHPATDFATSIQPDWLPPLDGVDGNVVEIYDVFQSFAQRVKGLATMLSFNTSLPKDVRAVGDVLEGMASEADAFNKLWFENVAGLDGDDENVKSRQQILRRLLKEINYSLDDEARQLYTKVATALRQRLPESDANEFAAAFHGALIADLEMTRKALENLSTAAASSTEVSLAEDDNGESWSGDGLREALQTGIHPRWWGDLSTAEKFHRPEMLPEAFGEFARRIDTIAHYLRTSEMEDTGQPQMAGQFLDELAYEARSLLTVWQATQESHAATEARRVAETTGGEPA